MRGKKRKIPRTFRKNRQKRQKKGLDPRLLHGNLGWDEDERTVTGERVLPAGEVTRRKGPASHEDLARAEEDKYGNLPEGLVLEIFGKSCIVRVGDEDWKCRLRGRIRELALNQRSILAVGDHVRVESIGPSEGVIMHVLPRKNEIARKSLGKDHLAHVVAANVDQMVIVSSAQAPPLSPGLIDRYLVVAHREEITPVICINKADLDTEENARICVEEYRSLGYEALMASIVDGRGIPELRELLVSKISVFLGQSGVGKSSILNALEPSLELLTGEVSKASAMGRHITTRARLLSLSFGAFVVDTPGVRNFDPFDLDTDAVLMGFVEIAENAQECRFHDCRHVDEPGCAVIAAFENGLILNRRMKSYLSLMRECEEKDRNR